MILYMKIVTLKGNASSETTNFQGGRGDGPLAPSMAISLLFMNKAYIPFFFHTSGK